MQLIQYDDMRLEFERILKKRGFTDADAAAAASPPATSGHPAHARRKLPDTSSATVTKAIPVHSWTVPS